MKILVSGSTGLIGSALVPALTAASYEVVRLLRSEPLPGEAALRWNPSDGFADPGALEGFEAVVHLAGENIAEGRWTDAKKQRIRSSRIEGTRRLCQALAERERRPKVLAAASATGFYGDRGAEELGEQTPAGEGFVAEVCREWEQATEPARQAGIRVVNLRIGAVLAANGGMLAKILPVFRLGLGGRLGSGWQYISWITMDDLVRAILHVLGDESILGPVNMVTPQPITNRDLTKTLGRVLRRPTLLPAPRAAMRLLLGEMTDGLLLASARVLPQRLTDSGFEFRDPDLELALRRVLNR